MLNKKSLMSVLCFCVLFTQNIYSQVITEYFPEGDALKSLPLLQFSVSKENVCKMPSFDLAELQKEDYLYDGKGLFRFGKAFDVSYSLNDGTWTNVDGGRLWSMTFESSNALSLNFVFNDFFLPDSAYLYIVNKDNTELFGPVTSEATKENGVFLTNVMQGDKATIYLFEPSSQYGRASLSVKRVVHGYRESDLMKRFREAKTQPTNCTLDIACFSTYEKESDAVGLMYDSSGNYVTCGSLVMSTDYSFKPYFLTGFCCIDLAYPPLDGVLSDAEKASVGNSAFIFRYKHSSCNGSSYITSSTYNGATFKAASHDSDFALLEINHDLKSNTDLSWLGWDRSTSTTPQSGACIHHTNGGPMEIAFDYDAFQTGTYPNHGSNCFWVVEFDDGVTKLNANGSPLLNGLKRVVGQLTGRGSYDATMSYCEQPQVYFGKFSKSWTGNGTNDTRLSNWLNPISSSQTTMDSYRAPYISGPSTLSGTCDYSIANLPSGFSVSWSYVLNSGSNVTFQPNVPQTNQCRLINSNLNMTDITLHADIYMGSTLTVSLTKNVSYTPPYIGTYSQTDNYNSNHIWDIPTTNFYEGDILLCRPKCNIYLHSSLFVGTTVSYSGDSPVYWSNDNNGNITLRYAYSASTWKYTTITASSGGNELCRFYINVIPANSMILGNPMLDIECVGNILNLTIGEKNTDSSELKSISDENGDINWNLTVTDIQTGRQIYSGIVEGWSKSLNTTGWTSGVYAIQAQIGNNIIVQKQVIK